MAALDLPPDPGAVQDVSLKDALAERYLSYALSTIMARSLPDVRDGLKPVQRRLLFAMRELRLDPASGFKKCARVVGDVIGKFHPHGDQAVYEALVRLAQDFAVRYPLVEGQGNFGNIDGDNAAAMRYTEARLTAVAEALLAGLDQDMVDFRPTYDGSEHEPVVLPARFPNLLANGAAGIAVGMATSIPPHHVGEICDALLHLIKHPQARADKLAELVPGPDFPTGGVLVEPRQSVIEAYKTGRGSFRLRAAWQKEEGKRGTWQIVVAEIPYQVQKSKLIERIAELLGEKKLPLLADVRDESAEDVRLVLAPKNREVDAEVLMEHLFRLTDLETRVPLNMNVLDANNRPGVMGLREVLRAFLDHRHEVLRRAAKHRLAEIARRLEILDGYLIVYLDIDKVIRIIRREDEPKPALIKAFKLSEVQAEAILNMRLRNLRKLEEMEIKQEHDRLKKEQTGLRGLLKDEDKRWAAIANEIREVKKSFASGKDGKRRTRLADPPPAVEVALETLVEKEPVTVICSAKGWVRAMKGHVAADQDLQFKEGDGPRFHLHAETTDKLLVLGTNGRCYTLACDKLPGGRGHGEPIRLMVELGEAEDVAQMMAFKGGRKLIFAAGDGRGFIAPEDEVVAGTRQGKIVLNLPAGVEAVTFAVVPEGADHLACIGVNRKLLIFPLADVPEMTRGRGITLQKHKQGGLSDVRAFKLKEGLVWRNAQGEFRETALRDWVGARAQAGRLPPKGFPRSNKFDNG
ncbi:MAG: DNA topoisomerase IV subunit A [Alphaproteobacteria bacterium]|nr:DNA topoisomerase IV subunit A [Alphaproteobacteria bacterium]